MSTVSRRRVLIAGVLGGSAAGGLDLADMMAASAAVVPADEDGYELWLRYRLIEDAGVRGTYAGALGRVFVQGAGTSMVLTAFELVRGLTGLLGAAPVLVSAPTAPGTLVAGVWAESATARGVVTAAQVEMAGPEGYVLASGVVSGVPCTVVTSLTAVGVLRGAFHLLRLVQTRKPVSGLSSVQRPANRLRMVNHWDNLNRTVERGYAGSSIFDWARLPQTESRYGDYARALASLGINGTVLNNVNASPTFLSTAFLPKVVALADALRPYGVKVYLSAYFDSPAALDPAIPNGDPGNPAVQNWWRVKANEIYAAIPDFGGWLVKAGSEGQPGPIQYGKTHAEGANMLARSLAPHGGLLIYRAFVHGGPSTWTEDAWREFKPQDGKFDANVVVQVKNGPMDFNPREPVNPLLGGLPGTNSMLELQVTQEYTGHSTHLCYLVPQWKEVLDFDTHAAGAGSFVRDIVAGTTFGYSRSGLAGVVNFGTDRNWTGHHLAAANTHGFGRLAWNPALSAQELADEWVTMTFGPDPQLRTVLTSMLLRSWQTYLDYTEVLGQGYLVHPLGDHFEPDMAQSQGWHRSDGSGAGFDRTRATGSGYAGFYAAPVAQTFESLASCPDELLLFFHRVPYTHRLRSGASVIGHIYDSHFAGLAAAIGLRDSWRSLAGRIDARRHAEVAQRFDQQVLWATVWRDHIVSYYFKLTRLLAGAQRWLQVELPAASTVLLGGQANQVTVSVGNATSNTVTAPVTVTVPGGWTALPGQISLGPGALGSTMVQVTPPLRPAAAQVSVTVSSTLQVLGATPQTVMVTPAASRCVLALDAGTDSSALLTGYARLSPATAWDAARGFGWSAGAPQSRDRGGDALRRDFCNDTTRRVLRIAVPAGLHNAYLLVGDRTVRCLPTIVTVNGAELARSQPLAANVFAWLQFNLDGGAAGRTFDLQLSSIPNEHWHLVAFVLLRAGV